MYIVTAKYRNISLELITHRTSFSFLKSDILYYDIERIFHLILEKFAWLICFFEVVCEIEKNILCDVDVSCK